MTEQFNAILATKQEDGKVKGHPVQLTLDDLPDHDVLVEVAYSTLNFKDALAMSGAGRICRKLPLILGIDLAGTVRQSRDNRFAAGDKVLINGCDLSELYDGGYSQFQRVQGDWLVPLPAEFTLHDAMAIGTAGFTAMLCVMALEDVGVAPEKGDVLVTGAAGGVGSLAVMILAHRGYRVIASTGRREQDDYLKSLGAADIIDREQLNQKPRPLDKEIWAGAVDAVGGMTTSNILSHLSYGGAVALCGMVGGLDFTASVMPLILRDVKLMGVNSTLIDRDRRLRAWHQLTTDIDVNKLRRLTETVAMTDLPAKVDQMLQGQVAGRVVVDVNQ